MHEIMEAKSHLETGHAETLLVGVTWQDMVRSAMPCFSMPCYVMLCYSIAYIILYHGLVSVCVYVWTKAERTPFLNGNRSIFALRISSVFLHVCKIMLFFFASSICWRCTEQL